MIGIFCLIAAGLSGIKGSIENLYAKTKWNQEHVNGKNDYNIYIDRKGAQRDLRTNQMVEEIVFHKDDLKEYGYLKGTFPNCIEGDIVLIDLANHTFIKNISELERERKLNDIYGNEITVIKSNIKDIVSPQRFLDDKKGYRYIDIKSKEIYLCRNFPVGNKFFRCFISEKTGQIVREADSQKKYEEQYRVKQLDNKILTKKEKEDFIKEFNELQEKGGWMKLKAQELESEKKYKEANQIGFNKYIYRERPNEYLFCNKYDSIDKFF